MSKSVADTKAKGKKKQIVESVVVFKGLPKKLRDVREVSKPFELKRGIFHNCYCYEKDEGAERDDDEEEEEYSNDDYEDEGGKWRDNRKMFANVPITNIKVGIWNDE
jgi:hypothetical protein